MGKSTVAKMIARRFNISWLQVDDLRLAMQWSGVALPSAEDTEKLYFFDSVPDVWQLPPERLCDAFIGVSEALAPAIAKVITNHVAIAEPIVLEGDGILPSLLARPDVREYGAGEHVRAVFVVPENADMIFDNMLARGWGIPGRNRTELRTNARAKWLYSQWLAKEANRYGLPVLEARPWDTLCERIMAAIEA